MSTVKDESAERRETEAQSRLARKCCPFPDGGYGYATAQGRQDWMRAHGVEDSDGIPKGVQADTDTAAPLYFWQLYSLLGRERIESIVRMFYTRVYEDDGNPWFRAAFTRVGGIEHHIRTQTAFWVDAMGGGPAYHGGDYRLNFHHAHNAEAVMNSKGAKLWMHYMGNMLREIDLGGVDPRVKPCLVDFLETKMRKYADLHGWEFAEEDFRLLERNDPELARLAGRLEHEA